MRARLGCEHLYRSDRTPTGRQLKIGPDPFSPRQCHMGQLNLPARESLFEVQIQPNERKGDGYRLAAFLRMLRGKRVDNMLMNEGDVSKGQRIGAQLVERFPDGPGFGSHRHRTLGLSEPTKARLLPSRRGAGLRRPIRQ